MRNDKILAWRVSSAQYRVCQLKTKYDTIDGNKLILPSFI